MPNRLTALDFMTAAVDLRTGTFNDRWKELIRFLFGDVAAISSATAVINRNDYGSLNALGLGAADEGYVAFETTLGHLLRWTGAVWEFAPGDPGNGYFEHYAIAPQSVGWALCDGSATSYLTIGATLTVTAITPPNMSGFYLKGGAYAGATVAAGGSTAVGATGTGSATGATDNDTGITEAAPSPLTTVDNNLDGSTVPVASQVHLHTPFVAHNHTITLSIPSLSVPALGIGTIDTAHVNAPIYFRR